MRLIQFYGQLFFDAVLQYEPVWEEQAVPDGYCWHKSNYPLREQFRIRDMGSDYPQLMFSMILPDSYLETTIYEDIKRYPSNYELSIVLLNRRIWLNAVLRADKLEDSLLGFMNHARGELMNIIDCLILMPEEANAGARENWN